MHINEGVSEHCIDALLRILTKMRWICSHQAAGLVRQLQYRDHKSMGPHHGK